jgi:hypothetical protein
MGDVLRMDYINSLPQPFLARFCGDKDFWPVNDLEVGTGLMRIDVCGKLQVKEFSEVLEIRDGNSNSHNPETFYTDYEAGTRLETPSENIARDMREGRFPQRSTPQMVSEHPTSKPDGHRK